MTNATPFWTPSVDWLNSVKLLRLKDPKTELLNHHAMLTFAQALEQARAYSPQTGWSDQERTEMSAFIQQASSVESAALREIIGQKTRDLLTDNQRFIENMENELGLKVMR